VVLIQLTKSNENSELFEYISERTSKSILIKIKQIPKQSKILQFLIAGFLIGFICQKQPYTDWANSFSKSCSNAFFD